VWSILLDPWYVGIFLVLLLAIVLRAWGIKHGLPFVYNPDEGGHFVPRAVNFFSHGFNPHYFVNPPAFSYFVYLVLAGWYRSGAKVMQAYLSNPTEVFLIARVSAAALGVLGVWLLYLTGWRLFDRRVGLVAGGLMAVAFLPVFYSHQALNDTPTIVPVSLALLGTAGVLRHGRKRDYLIAGIGLGLGAATKYTAGVVVLPLLAATALDIRSKHRWQGPLAGMALAAVVAIASFVAANPYSILDHHTFLSELQLVSPGHTVTASGKLGQAQQNGVLYYLWTLTWGLGWVPAVAALGGSVSLLKEDRGRAAVLLPAPVLFLFYMGLQSRYFGRWIMPVFPILILLAAYSTSRLLSVVVPSVRQFAPIVVAVVVGALIGQGLVTSIHTDMVLSRTDTQALARQWILSHIPAGSIMVVEPIYLKLQPLGGDPRGPGGRNTHRRWKFFGVRRALVRAGLASQSILAKKGAPEFQRVIRPELIDIYAREGACWVVTGSYAWGRAFAVPELVPRAIAYYRELRRRSRVAYQITPYRAADGPVPFNFDWSSDYYPFAYARPGPEIIVYRLTAGTCP